MATTTRFASGWMFTITAVLVGWFSAFPTSAVAQGAGSPGNNAVYYQPGSSGTCCQGSGAFIDASVFPVKVTSPNFCSVLNYVLNPANHVITSSGAVIDARGLPGSSGTSMTCTASPWAGITSPPPSTILLPAGTIVIPTPWVLPPYTHLFGVGDSIVQASSGTWTTSGTTIQACNSGTCTFSGDMIDFGGSPACSSCAEVSIANGGRDTVSKFWVWARLKLPALLVLVHAQLV